MQHWQEIKTLYGRKKNKRRGTGTTVYKYSDCDRCDISNYIDTAGANKSSQCIDWGKLLREPSKASS